MKARTPITGPTKVSACQTFALSGCIDVCHLADVTCLTYEEVPKVKMFAAAASMVLVLFKIMEYSCSDSLSNQLLCPILNYYSENIRDGTFCLTV